jgi:serine/threonine protein kinase
MLVAARSHISCSDSVAARVGRTLRDKWHLERLIAVGGLAAVYAATHRNGMRGAVKVLHREWSSDPDVVSRFRREGYIANRVEHPGAVHVLDDDVDEDGSAFLVMELLLGEDLDHRAARTAYKLRADEVLSITVRLLDVLAAAHDRGIIHRDIKPENIFLTQTGEVKVLDFGIAHLGQAEPPCPSITFEGIPMGTPGFMSPEQARGRWDLVGIQSDLWSVGATMFKLLSGEYVHEETTAAEMLAAIITRAAPSLATVLPGAAPPLVGLVDHALAMKFADRWPDARTMRTAVREAYLAMYDVPLAAANAGGGVPSPLAYSFPGPPLLHAAVAMSLRGSPHARVRRSWAIASAFVLVLASTGALFGVRAARAARPALAAAPSVSSEAPATKMATPSAPEGLPPAVLPRAPDVSAKMPATLPHTPSSGASARAVGAKPSPLFPAAAARLSAASSLASAHRAALYESRY